MNTIRSICTKIILVSLFFLLTACAQTLAADPAVTRSIASHELRDYDTNPPAVKKLIDRALVLTQKRLTYLYGSANPENGGMDCSGTIYYLLRTLNINNVPRQADQMYDWTWRKGHFYAVNSRSTQSFEFSHLKPGDLLFWSGTYDVHRDPPVSHVMIYLGKSHTGEMLMFGASDGRTYQHKRMNGVSVFDFALPSEHSKSRFLGYSCIPQLTC